MVSIDTYVIGLLPEVNLAFWLISITVYIVMFGAAALFLYRRKISEVLQLGAGLILTFVFVQVIKLAVARERPNGFDIRSFPSQHTAFAFFLATILPVQSKEQRVAYYGWAVLVSFSRLVLLEHWFTDVIVGAIIGTGLGYLMKTEKIKKIVAKR